MTTFVLVHGAWHGGWAWNEVKTELEKQNHRVFAPTMTGSGERKHLLSPQLTINTLVDDIANVLVFEELYEVVLVGHSFGGAVISAVAEIMPHRVKQLIYLDAAVLEHNESMFSCMPAAIATERKAQAIHTTQGLVLPVPNASQLGIAEAIQWQKIQDKLTPQPLITYDTPLILTNLPGEGFYCTYIVCQSPLYLPLAWARERVKGYGWPMLTINTGHDAMVTAPLLLSNTLVKLSEYE